MPLYSRVFLDETLTHLCGIDNPTCVYRMHQGLFLLVSSRYLFPQGTVSWYIYHILRTGFSLALCLNIPMHAEELKLSKPREQHFLCTHSRDFRAHRMAAEVSSSRR